MCVCGGGGEKFIIMINGPFFIVTLLVHLQISTSCVNALGKSVKSETPWGKGCRQSTLVCFKRDCLLV